ncbi:MAG: glycosyltransferase family 4 protein [Candidatus Azambacteria bacterium]|nr:glycosyltransferase family 4 protein [Candidatus Azambacteria bacterium]
MKESQKKLILVITPHKKGGPWQWGADLVNELNKNSEFKAEHIFKIRDKLFSPFRPGVKLIHTTNPLAFSVLLKPTILTVHGKIFGLFWNFFYLLGYYRASVVTAPSEFLKKSLNFKKALVIPNAVDLSKFNQVNLMERDFFNILTVTKFWFPGKARGLFELAQIIFNLAKDFDKRINWRIVGYGPLLEDVKKSITALEKPANLSVQWFGFDMPQKYFSDSDIFAYFSFEDNMPIAIMEAMASGLPVVTNKVGAVNEIINSGRDGFIALNHQDYQNILLKLMNDFDFRKNIGETARKKIEENFSWKVILPKWIEIYKSLMRY